MHSRLLHNGEIVDTREKRLSPGQVGFLNGWGVFSTLRVTEGVLFAYERHWVRMQKDAKLFHVPMPADPDQFRADLLRLVEANQAFDATLRVAVVRNRGGYFEAPGLERDYDVVAFTTALQKWGSGVRLGIQRQARHSGCEFRGAKITAWSHNLTWLENARQAGFDEVVLLDDHDRVSECTSANIFAIFGNYVVTPSLESGCLPGITRDIILRNCFIDGITLEEGDLRLDDLYRADAAFITSSTRDLLSILSVGGRDLGQSDGVRQRLAAAFRVFRETYVAQRKVGVLAGIED
ncbi:MAG: aminotransferase class IV [Bryobacteraceae bacterium]